MSKITFSGAWEPDDPPNTYINRIDLGPDCTSEMAVKLAEGIERLMDKYGLPRIDPASEQRYKVKVITRNMDYIDVVAPNQQEAEDLAIEQAEKLRPGRGEHSGPQSFAVEEIVKLSAGKP